jgi:hypothetical protein
MDREEFEGKLRGGLDAAGLQDLFDNPESRQHMVAEMEDLARLRDRVGVRACLTPQLRRLVETARERDYNRVLTDEQLSRVSSRGWHVLTPQMTHAYADGVEVAEHLRCSVQLAVFGTDEPEEAMLDVSERDLLRLRRLDAPQHELRTDLDAVLQVMGDTARFYDNSTGVQLLGDGSDAGEWFTGPDIAESIRTFEPWWVNSEVLTLVEFAASTLPDGAALENQPVPGFALFERPVEMTGAQGEDLDIVAISWNAASIHGWERADHGVGLRFAVFGPWDGESVLARFFVAFHLLAEQRVMSRRSHRPERGIRRAAERMKLVSTICVVELRRQSSRTTEGELRHVEWSHRWMVSGCWVHRWNERKQSVTVFWRRAHIKGPTDLPLVLKEKFVRFTR